MNNPCISGGLHSGTYNSILAVDFVCMFDGMMGLLVASCWASTQLTHPTSVAI
jgi:hypothetical protein